MMTGRRMPNVIGPGIDSCTLTATDRWIPASADSLCNNASPRAHTELDRRSERKCHVPARTGSTQSNMPAAQIAHRIADAVTPVDSIRNVSTDSCASKLPEMDSS